jgi:hypothetical protein
MMKVSFWEGTSTDSVKDDFGMWKLVFHKVWQVEEKG